MNMYHFKRAVVSAGLSLDRPPLVGTNNDDGFGHSVDFNSTGSICVVGAPWFQSDNKGQVKVYKRNETTRLWQQLGNAITGQPQEQLGYSVSINNSGLRIVVGSKSRGLDQDEFTTLGLIYIYDYDSTTSQWVLNATIGGEGTGYWSGFSVSINGDGSIIASGSPKDDASGEDRGSVVIYQEDPTNVGSWSNIGILYGEAVADNSGWSVALNTGGDILAVGAPFNDATGNESGHVRIYQYVSGTTWIPLGNDIDGTPASKAGFSVDLNSDGTIIAIGNIQDSTYAASGGVVKMFRYQSGIWSQYGTNIVVGAAGDLIGYSVSLNSRGNILAAGSPFRDSGSKLDIGETNIYKLSDNNIWKKLYPRVSGITAGEKSGWAVSLSKNARKLIIGAPEYTNKLGQKLGIARIYSLPQKSAFWTFDNKIATLNGFSVSTTTASTVNIRWGDGLSDALQTTTSIPGVTINHSYTTI